MDEEETKIEEETKEPEPVDTGEGDKPKVPSVITKANFAAERLEAANNKKEELLAREEELLAEKRIAGKAEAGQGTIKTKEETEAEYVEKFRRGEVNPLEDDGIKA